MLTAGLTTMDMASVPVFDAESVTITVKLEVPAVVGVPLIAPAADKVNPAGRELPLARDHA